MAYNFLIAEDKDSIRHLYNTVLSSEFPGVTLHLAETGDAAISLLEDMLRKGIRSDLILTDVNMPGKADGFSVLEYALPYSIPVIIASARVEHRERALENGAAGFVNKPFAINDLVAVVNSALDQGK